MTAYREALETSLPERVPLQWATIRKSHGTVLDTFDASGKGPARLEEGSTGNRHAREEFSRASSSDWAETTKTCDLATA